MERPKYEYDAESPMMNGGVDDIKKAIPDYFVKMSIQEAYRELEVTLNVLRNNQKFNNGKMLQTDLIKLEGVILRLFGFIREMILDQLPLEKMKKREPRLYRLFLEIDALRYGKIRMTYQKGVDYEGFLLNRLHSLNITNLLINEGTYLDNFDD